MRELEMWLMMAAGLGLIMGAWGLMCFRNGGRSGSFGRALSVTALVFLGAGSGFAAFHRAEGLVPLGLCAGLLLVGLVSCEPRPESALVERR